MLPVELHLRLQDGAEGRVVGGLSDADTSGPPSRSPQWRMG